MGEDNFFSDDDFDDSTLVELEQHALTSTQKPSATKAPRPAQPARNPPSRVAPINRVGALNKNLPWRPPQAKPPPVFPSRVVRQPSAPSSSDYGLDDENVVNLDEPQSANPAATDYTTAPSRALRPSIPSRPASRPALDPETEAAFAAADAELGAHVPSQWSHAPHLQPKNDGDIDVSSLQARIAELEAEQARLRQAEQDARNAALAKQGEIAIVRSNQEKAAKEYERRIEVMKKTYADDAARQKQELEASHKENQKMQTDNRFLQHDLAQEAERAKRAGPAKTRPTASNKEKETPKKAKRTGLGDGFDDEEVRVISPSKSKERPKDQTPKHAAKRKRTAHDSPAPALSFTQPVRQDSNDQPAASFASVASEALAGSSVEDDRYAFMQRLLNHRPVKGHARSLEALTKHTFPTKPEMTVSSMLLDRLSRTGPAKDTECMPLKLSLALLDVWSRCLDDQYYAAQYLILDLLNFGIAYQLASVIAQLIEDAVPVCMRAIKEISHTRLRASKNPKVAANLDREAFTKLEDEADVDGVLDLLLRLCQAASLVSGRLEAFWHEIDFTDLMALLQKAQPVNQIITALKLVALSAQSHSFGTIETTDSLGDAENQAKRENALIDRLSTLLHETPEVPHDEPPYTESEITELHLEILQAFRAMCLTAHCCSLLAHHHYAVGRFVRFLNSQVDKLYTVPPSVGLAPQLASDGTPIPTAHDYVASTVNTTVRIIYHLLRTHDDSIDITQKYRTVHGGHNKFLISMSRIAFSEQLVFEQGIEEEVAEAAHEILNNALSPEEGEALAMAVETPRGTRASRGVAMGEEEPAEEVLVEDAEMGEEPGYQQSEQPVRLMTYYCMNGVAGIFGGLLGYAIGHITTGLQEWMYVFLVFGAVSLTWSVIFIIFMPDLPATARFLSDHEKIVEVDRVALNRQGVKNKVFERYQAWQTVRDPKTWILFVMAVAAQIPNAAQSSFTSLILEGFGFGALETQYMQIPGNVIQIVSLLVSGCVSSHWPNLRCITMIVGNVVCVGAGSALVALSSDQKWGRLVALWLCSFQSVGFAMSLTMVSSNIAGYTKKQLTGAALFVGYCVGNVIGPQTFISSEAPQYPSAYVAIMVGYCVKTVMVVVLYIYMWSVNIRRDRSAAMSNNAQTAAEKEKEGIENGMHDMTELDNP
ncbi:hypothetical protein EJ03DRAFT_372461 [Teratosphaeria nubilosa]|uniref:MFS general substrate transporter n=1 Tax=Teratosphaeria nubilosa TaxID=161662 RepID=A0A6G1LG95_9PEZI|nr:hypothetical protein EJ03DRAFT_372461 [Teratosphaeria nubilosa]